MAVSNEQRRAVYQYYRSQGFSPAEARARRNQPLKVFEDYAERRAFASKEERKYIKMPNIPASDRSIKQARRRLEDLGINKTTINRITRKKSDVLKITTQLELYYKKVNSVRKDKAGKKAWAELKKELTAEALLKGDFWDIMGERYEYIVGVVL